MLDIKFIREHQKEVEKAAKLKRIDVDISKILKLDDERRKLIQQVEKIRAQKNAASDKIASLKGEAKKEAIERMRKVSEEEKKLSEELKTVESKFEYAMLFVPQIPSKKTPIGKDNTENKELSTWGEIPKFDFEPLDHVQLGEKLDILDIPRAAKIAGSRTYFLKNEGVQLELAILQFTLDFLTKTGFTPFIVPLLVHDEAMIGTSYFPGGEEQAYRIEKDKLNLIGTSEVSVTSYHSGEILNESDLPKFYAGISSCFRREAGTYGKDTHGLYRVHQFQKVEQVVVCKNDETESMAMHQMIQRNAEEILKMLGLPYRVVAVCTGDMGIGQFYKTDIETWMPSRKAYGETHSCSAFLDFQARRLNMRYRDKNGEIKFCHTLNNTCIASPRILIPLLETYQNKDGSVTIPEALRPYMNKKKKITNC